MKEAEINKLLNRCSTKRWKAIHIHHKGKDATKNIFGMGYYSETLKIPVYIGYN